MSNLTKKQSLVSDLPYLKIQNLSLEEKALFMSQVLDIESYVTNQDIDQTLLETLAGVILYRHLDKQQKIEIMTMIHSLGNRRLASVLITKVTDVIVSPHWGIWSFTTDELLKDEAFHKMIDTYMSNIGLTVSGLGMTNLLKQAWQKKRLSKGGIAILAIWGVAIANKHLLIKTKPRAVTNGHFSIVSIKG